MKVKLIFQCIGFVFFFFSCSTEDKQESYFSLEINPQNSERVELNKFCSQIELIPLQTTKQSVFGDCKKVEYSNGRFYIEDRISNAIFVFSDDGAFLFSTLKHKGRGPGQYSHFQDFNINRFTGNIELLDSPNNRILIYDQDANFIKSILLASELSPFLNHFKELSEEIYFFYSRINRFGKESMAFYSMTEGIILKKTAPILEKTENLPVFRDIPLYYFNGSLYFSHPYPANQVYLVDPIELDIKLNIELDFGKYNFTLDQIEKNKTKGYFNSFILDNEKRYAFVQDVKQNSGFLLVYYLFDGKTYVVKYNKTNNTSEAGYNIPYTTGQLLPPNILDDNYLYYFSDPVYVKYLISQDLMDGASIHILESINENDNPIIIKYKLK